MLELNQNRLKFSFPELHPDAECYVEFQRTLRIPDDNNEYPLPPGLGQFPMYHVDDYAQTIPAKWVTHGGVFLPMYQSEAMWINFSGNYPFAIKIAAGKINAVSGSSWNNHLQQDPQDYVVIPDQPWLDGFNVSKGKIRQFVAMPLGQGYSAEEQLTGKAEHGGLQIIAYPLRRELYEEILARRKKLADEMSIERSLSKCMSAPCEPAVVEMGLAPGGLMTQEIYDDPHGLDAWDTRHASRCFVHIVNSENFITITGAKPPTLPPSAQAYNDAGMPWFEYYAGDKNVLDGSSQLATLDSVASKAIKNSDFDLLKDNKSLDPGNVNHLSSQQVRDGKF